MLELHLVATVFMAGLIVFVQVVHYPLMARVGAASFVKYERSHTVRTGWVVVPPMIIELLCAIVLVFQPPSATDRPLVWLGLGLLAIVWASTALFQAPAHGALVRGFDADVHRRLVRSNWIRTIAWLARVPVAVVLIS